MKDETACPTPSVKNKKPEPPQPEPSFELWNPMNQPSDGMDSDFDDLMHSG